MGRPLSRLAVGEGGTVLAIRGHGFVAVRLMEMGLTPGTEVVLVKRAPLGDPLELRVRGFHLSLRAAEADRVEVSG